MKLKKDFIVHQSGDEQIMVDASGNFNGLIRSNKTAAFIISCLETETSAEEITDKMVARFDAPRSVVASDIEKVIAALRSVGALDE